MESDSETKEPDGWLGTIPTVRPSKDTDQVHLAGSGIASGKGSERGSEMEGSTVNVMLIKPSSTAEGTSQKSWGQGRIQDRRMRPNGWG